MYYIVGSMYIFHWFYISIWYLNKEIRGILKQEEYWKNVYLFLTSNSSMLEDLIRYVKLCNVILIQYTYSDTGIYTTL